MFFRGCINCGWYERVASAVDMMIQTTCPDCGNISVGSMDASQFELCRQANKEMVLRDDAEQATQED